MGIIANLLDLKNLILTKESKNNFSGGKKMSAKLLYIIGGIVTSEKTEDNH